MSNLPKQVRAGSLLSIWVSDLPGDRLVSFVIVSGREDESVTRENFWYFHSGQGMKRATRVAVEREIEDGWVRVEVY